MIPLHIGRAVSRFASAKNPARASRLGSLGTRASELALLLAALHGLTACGPGFEPASAVRTLRVLGVEKSNPYPKPGESVELALLWDDPKKRDNITLAWSPPCLNPGSDLYFGCFQSFAAPSDDPTAFVPVKASEDSRHSIQVPDDIVSTHMAPAPGQPAYGLVYEFFALCAGSIGFEIPKQQGALPLVCKDENGNTLGPDDFVVGYTSLYTFGDGAANANPIVTGIEVQGTPFLGLKADPMSPACVGPECVPAGPLPLGDVDCADAANASRCFPACAGDGASSCPAISVRATIDTSSAEKDTISATYYGRDYWEQVWVDYYSDAGKFDSGVRLVNDAQRGWNTDFTAKFRAPKEPGPVTLWAVVHDNRGGMSWVRTQIGIQAK